ncbi:hypothetical protein [Yersinia sp. 2545 StPb PI]|uniref:hypothetical protein n=1 Tax=Yersinia sp. 2545 StPb PI TaxID=3117410 RepID=UPI003FA48E0E
MLIEMEGKRFGRLVVKGYSGHSGSGKSLWRCQCDCGKNKVILGVSLRHGKALSCGCLQKEITSKNSKTHGMTKSKAYNSWSAMMQRCTNRKSENFASYGGRGVTVCDRWLKFENFISDMGDPSNGETIDRIDVNGNYEPSNCRWLSMKDQSRNRRNNRIIHTPKGDMCVSEAAEVFGIGVQTLFYRLNHGWDTERALNL